MLINADAQDDVSMTGQRPAALARHYDGVLLSSVSERCGVTSGEVMGLIQLRLRQAPTAALTRFSQIGWIGKVPWCALHTESNY